MYRLVEPILRIGFQQVVDGIHLKSLDGVLVVGRAEDDQGRLFEQVEQFQSCQFRHLDIEEYQVGLQLLDGFQTAETIGKFAQDLNFRKILQVKLNNIPGGLFIVDKNGAEGHRLLLITVYEDKRIKDCVIRRQFPADQAVLISVFGRLKNTENLVPSTTVRSNLSFL